MTRGMVCEPDGQHSCKDALQAALVFVVGFVHRVVVDVLVISFLWSRLRESLQLQSVSTVCGVCLALF